MDVECYVNSNDVTGKDALQVLEGRRKHLKWTKGERVLDMGCGPGDVTANVVLPFIPEDSTLVGCDVSEGMLEECKKYEIKGRLTYKKLDIQKKGLDDGWERESFNKIFSFYCFHWITDQRQAMQNIYSLLKPGGEILFMFLTPDNAEYIVFETLKQSPKWNRFVKDVNWFYKTNDPILHFEGLLESAGFQDIDCYLMKTKHRFATWHIYMELMKSIIPLVRHIPDEVKSEFIGELDDLLKQQSHNVLHYDGGITAEYNLIVTSAKRGKQ